MAFVGAGPQIDLRLDPNSDNPFRLQFTDAAGAAIDFTGSTFRLSVKAIDDGNNAAGPILLTLSSGAGISGNVAQGEFTLTFPDAADGGLTEGRYAYTCLRIAGGAAVEPHCWGFITVGQGIATL